MKTLFLSILFFTIAFVGLSQDVIVKKDGTKIEAKVLEITSTTVRFKRHDQQDGPMRSLEISSLKEIIYEDGSWDDFSDTVPVEEEVEERPVSPRPERKEKDVLLDGGLNIDLLLGAGLTTRNYSQAIYDPITGFYTEEFYSERVANIGIGLRLGSKFYIGGTDKWRPGIQANWIRFGIYVDPNDFSSIILGSKTISPVNVGMANVFKFSDNLGLEANLTGGLNMEINFDDGRAVAGIALTPEVKFRYKQLAVGLDYMRIFGIDDLSGSSIGNGEGSWDVISLSIGAKF